MKTIEEKARAYDEAVINGSRLWECGEITRENYEYIFPQLKESDERIRKEVIAFLKENLETGRAEETWSISGLERWITWLEKQGKKEYALKSSKDVDVHKFVQYIEKQAKAYELNLPNRSYDIYGFAKDILSWLEKQGEQKSVSCNEEDKKIINFLRKCVQEPMGTNFLGDIRKADVLAWLEKQGKKQQKTLIWKHWKDGIAGNGEGKPIYLTKDGYTYRLSSVLSFECDYIELSELDKLSEKQGEIDIVSYEIAEKEKREFVGDGFIKCYADFQDFKEGETYWLEYVGNDKYNVRSDNLLGKMYHITPCQLYTVFKKQTWLEKQGEQKPFDYEVQKDFAPKSAMEVIKEEKVDNANKVKQKDYSSIDPHFFKPVDKVKPKFKVGDWITNGACIIQITSVDDRYYWHDNDCVGGDIESIDKEYHLWTIQDAKDGDVLVCDVDKSPFIFKGFDRFHPKCPVAYCGIDDNGTFIFNSGDGWWTDEEVYPATKEQRDLLFQKMHEAGYEWDDEKK